MEEPLGPDEEGGKRQEMGRAARVLTRQEQANPTVQGGGKGMDWGRILDTTLIKSL